MSQFLFKTLEIIFSSNENRFMLPLFARRMEIGRGAKGDGARWNSKNVIFRVAYQSKGQDNEEKHGVFCPFCPLTIAFAANRMLRNLASELCDIMIHHFHQIVFLFSFRTNRLSPV